MNEAGAWTVALRRMLTQWMLKEWPAALILAALGALIGLLSRMYLPTLSLLELMRARP